VSYRCAKCHKPITGQPIRLVTELEPMEYSIQCDEFGDTVDHGGYGWKIIKEENFCPACAETVAKPELPKKKPNYRRYYR